LPFTTHFLQKDCDQLSFTSSVSRLYDSLCECPEVIDHSITFEWMTMYTIIYYKASFYFCPNCSSKKTIQMLHNVACDIGCRCFGFFL